MGLEVLLTAAGFGAQSHVLKWVRDGSPLRDARSELRVERAGPAEAEEIDAVLLAAFGQRPNSVPLASDLVGRPRWHHYVARDGRAVVATATMYVHEGFAWLGAAGTLASHRCRGAHGALIARRLDDARALGCHTFTTETQPDGHDKPNPSSHNMERAGFRVAYRRSNWVFPDPGRA